MSSIRLFILSSFAELGPMHGHRLRLEAESKHVSLWTDISVGAVYGAMSRLASEGLLQEVGQEREGKRPVRQIYDITGEGRQALTQIRQEALEEVWFRHDPFDLALTRCDPTTLEHLPAVLAARLKTVRDLLATARHNVEWARPHVGPAKLWALRHSEHRLDAEATYLMALLENVGSIVAAGSG